MDRRTVRHIDRQTDRQTDRQQIDRKNRNMQSGREKQAKETRQNWNNI